MEFDGEKKSNIIDFYLLDTVICQTDLTVTGATGPKNVKPIYNISIVTYRQTLIKVYDSYLLTQVDHKCCCLR